MHSNKIIFINKNNKFKRKKIKADAVITDQKKFPIAVLTADCVPILLHDNKKNMIAAVHAGWKGAFKNIVNKVISFMLKKGCKRNDIIAAIGPCIGKANYNFYCMEIIQAAVRPLLLWTGFHLGFLTRVSFKLKEKK